MAKLKAIFFDIGNVLIETDDRALFKNYFQSEKEMEKFLITAFNTSLLPEWYIQETSESLKHLSKLYPEYSDAYKYYDNNYEKIFVNAVEGMPELIKRLREKDIKIILISNYAYDRFVRATKVLTFLNDVDAQIISGNLGFKKPNSLIFDKAKEALENLEIKLDEAIFFDDRQINIDGAIKSGIKSKLFTTYADTKQTINELLI